MTVGFLTASESMRSEALEASHRRLLAAREALGVDATEETRNDPALLLMALLGHAARMEGLEGVWLVLVALMGAYPGEPTVRATGRLLEVEKPSEVLRWLLRTAQTEARNVGSLQSDIDIVTDRVVVDVNVSARWPHVTGVQRVVRETARLWKQDHDVELVVWNETGGGYRRLTSTEWARISDPAQIRPVDELVSADELETVDATVVVPWGAPLILMEVPFTPQSPRLSALAQFSPSPIRLVGYDCIPVVSADLVPREEPEKFGHYVDVVKVAERIAAISHSASEEFRGLASAVTAQGLSSPEVTPCVLPSETDLGSGEVGDSEVPGLPLVVAIGTLGPRKNQAAILVAAELLWREGLQFELRLLGHGAGTGTVLAGLIKRLEAADRPLALEKKADDDRVAESLLHARCVVFPSLHEGFGLPVVEALSAGAPVITSNHGSLAEIAEGGGVLTIDPEDTDALADAMRQLLTDDVLHDRLVEEAKARPVRTWRDYATDLWAVLGS
ncbi:MAG: glycosyltransferase [Aeromicrobium sp.]